MRGFTLLEVVIVVLVLGMVATIVFPQLAASLSGARLDGATDEVLTAVQYAQERAASSGNPWRVTFDADRETISVSYARFDHLEDLFDTGRPQNSVDDFKDDKTSYLVADRPNMKAKPYTVDLRSDLNFKGVDLISAAFNGDELLEFNAGGTPVSGGTVTLGFGGKIRVLTVATLTGQATVQ